MGPVDWMVVGITDLDEMRHLREQVLRIRVMVLERAIKRFLDEGDRDRLARAYSNEWVKPLGENDE